MHKKGKVEALAKLMDRLKVYNEEFDYHFQLSVDKTGANLFFQLIAKRYEHNSTLITTNQPFSKWGEVFSDATLANAILDRLLHHSHVIKMVGPSYRTKDYHDLVDVEDK